MNGIVSRENLGRNGLELVVEETRKFDKIVRDTYEEVAMNLFGTKVPSGFAVFAYGSPGRIELVGGDSDADIFLVEKEKTPRSTEFKKRLKERWGTFGFSKVDLPPWGTYDEIDIYLEKSLVEGNQVLETRFLAGDESVMQEVSQRKQKFDSIERGLRNIIFNRLYFNQYFRQRIRDGALNLKYCPGGSRDFLFVYWQDKLDRMIRKEPDDPLYSPRVQNGLNRLFAQGKIPEGNFKGVLEAINFMVELRSDVLAINRDTLDRGLTFLDNQTLERLHSIGYLSPENVRSVFNEYRQRIKGLSQLVWEETIQKAGSIRGRNWITHFREAYDSETHEDIRERIPSDDPLISTALIWGASESGQKVLFDNLARKYHQTGDWSLIGSLVCSPLCDAEVLHHFGTGQLKERGYGYLLRVVARNKNVKKETLKSIAEDPRLESRYTEVAKSALEGGNGVANNQV